MRMLVYYEMVNGFWKNDLKDEEVKEYETKIRTQQERINVLVSHAEERENTITEAIQSLTKIKEELAALKKDQTKSLEEVKESQHSANIILNDLKNKQEYAEGYKSTIEKLQANCDEILGKLKLSQEAISTQQRESERINTALTEKATQFEFSSKEITEKVKAMLSEVTEHNEKVKKMMGSIADGTLGHSFNERKKGVKIGAIIWGVVSLLLLVVMVCWIYYIFVELSANTGNVWANILINSVKSSPVVFAFGFALSEYNKERNMMEEYAFKEAVAVTLTAYLDQLEGETDENKRNLLLQTVTDLYKRPFISSKEYKMLNLKGKDVKDVITELNKTLTEIVKNK